MVFNLNSGWYQIRSLSVLPIGCFHERYARGIARSSARFAFESRNFLSPRNESAYTRANGQSVPGSRAGTPSYYFYGPKTSVGITIISLQDSNEFHPRLPCSLPFSLSLSASGPCSSLLRSLRSPLLLFIRFSLIPSFLSYSPFFSLTPLYFLSLILAAVRRGARGPHDRSPGREKQETDSDR